MPTLRSFPIGTNQVLYGNCARNACKEMKMHPKLHGKKIKFPT